MKINKKIFVVVLILMLIPVYVFADGKYVTLDSCQEGDMVKLKDSEGLVTLYHLYTVTTPSTNHILKGEESYSKEALEFTCEKLTNATSIVIEEVENGIDDYGEAYVFYDDNLLQEELLKEGYAKISYLEESDPYYDRLISAEISAKENNVGLWNTEEIIDEMVDDIDNSSSKNNKEEYNPIVKFFNSILDGVVASVNKMIDSILQKIDNML